MKISENIAELAGVARTLPDVKPQAVVPSPEPPSPEPPSDVAKLSSQARQTLSLSDEAAASPKREEVGESIGRLKEKILERVFQAEAVRSLRSGLPILAGRVDETATIEVAAQVAEGRLPSNS